MTTDSSKEFGKKLRKAIYPGQRLCRIEFSDGKSTNDFVPEEILEDPAQCATEWFNEFKKGRIFKSFTRRTSGRQGLSASRHRLKMRIRIKPTDKLPLELSPSERKLLIDNVFDPRIC